MAINWGTATYAEKVHELAMLDPSYVEARAKSGPTTDWVYPAGGAAGPPAPYTPTQQAADQQRKSAAIGQGTYWGPSPTVTIKSDGGSPKSDGGSSNKLLEEAIQRQKDLETESAKKAQDLEKQQKAEIDARYKEAMKNLNAMGGLIGGQKEALIAEIGNQYLASLSQLRTQKAGIVEDISLSKEQAAGRLGETTQESSRRKEDANTAAVRLYNELITGGQQRFGGASSAGEAYGSVLGSELMRNQGMNQAQHEQLVQQATKTHEDFLQQVESASRKLEMEYAENERQVESNKKSQLFSAETEFNTQMVALAKDKASAGDVKYIDQINLLSELRNKTYQITMQAQQSLASLKNYAIESARELELQAQNSTSALDKFLRETGYGSDMDNPITGQEMGGKSFSDYTGYRIPTTSTNEEDLIGQTPLGYSLQQTTGGYGY